MDFESIKEECFAPKRGESVREQGIQEIEYKTDGGGLSGQRYIPVKLYRLSSVSSEPCKMEGVLGNGAGERGQGS